MATVGEDLVAHLCARGVDTVFGIPGVHTIALYRGLAGSGIRHVTPRHEQAAGFMADGFARASGRPGVAFVITGPGVTNTLTPMGQARADSVPILVISGVNTRASLGLGLGHLHELPDQLGLVGQVALEAFRIEQPDEVVPVVDRAMRRLAVDRPGPVHIELPLDLAREPAQAPSGDGVATQAAPERPKPTPSKLADAVAMLAGASRPLILIGGGARHSRVVELAERLDAPVVQTVNARGAMFGHPLGVPASPSLHAVRELMAQADVVLALGTEFGPTDYDMFGRDPEYVPPCLIRVDICPEQLARREATLRIQGDAASVVEALLPMLGQGACEGAGRAQAARQAGWEEVGPKVRGEVAILNAIRDAMPGAFFIGDSTQPVYAGNLWYDHDRPGGWFNAATGFGALGYAIPAAIGAAVAVPDAPVVCICGDGGAQFSLPELMTARDENLPITFVIWNNHGYGEIAQSMRDAGVEVIGCDPTPPEFGAIATACGMPFASVPAEPAAVEQAFAGWAGVSGPRLLEIRAG